MSANNFHEIVDFVKQIYPDQNFIPLHAPVFIGNEKKYLNEAIDSTFVSSVGPFVNKVEEMMAAIAGTKYAVAVVNGTAALHMALIVAGVSAGDEVITQSLTFIATCNAISYQKAAPVFIDIDRDTLGMSSSSLEFFLENRCEIRSDGNTYNRETGRRIAACVPMHTFGMPCRINEIAAMCKKFNIVLIEDAAESMGSTFNQQSTGSFGDFGVFSFNGNKIVTCGGGGAIVTNNEQLAQRAKHLTTQAKVAHAWRFEHDSVGYNYRLPNINAALACAQLENLSMFVEKKRNQSSNYRNFFRSRKEVFVDEIEGASSNFWLNSILFDDYMQRDEFLAYSNANRVMTRPVWEPMHHLDMFRDAETGNLANTEWVAERLVNIPSSVKV